MRCQTCRGPIHGGFFNRTEGVSCEACGVLAYRLCRRAPDLSWPCSIPDRVWAALDEVHPGQGSISR